MCIGMSVPICERMVLVGLCVVCVCGWVGVRARVYARLNHSHVVNID